GSAEFDPLVPVCDFEQELSIIHLMRVATIHFQPSIAYFEFCGTYKPTEVGEILQGIDVVVVPSTWYENYPLALHEALACNVPVIAADIGGASEKIRNFSNGFTFRAGDEGDLKSKLQHVVENPE